jgi:hypothetical protein
MAADAWPWLDAPAGKRQESPDRVGNEVAIVFVELPALTTHEAQAFGQAHSDR